MTSRLTFTDHLITETALTEYIKLKCATDKYLEENTIANTQLTKQFVPKKSQEVIKKVRKLTSRQTCSLFPEKIRQSSQC